MKLKVELDHTTLEVAYNVISDKIEDLGTSIKVLITDTRCPKDIMDNKMIQREKLREALEDIGRLKNEFS